MLIGMLSVFLSVFLDGIGGDSRIVDVRIAYTPGETIIPEPETLPLIVGVIAAIAFISLAIKRLRTTGDRRARHRLLAIASLIAILTIASALALAYRSKPISEARVMRYTPPTKPTHSLTISIGELPKYIRSNESLYFSCQTELEVLATARETMPNSLPLSLNATHQYAASLGFRSLGLDAVPSTTPPGQLMPLEVGKPLSWNWILAPKKGTEDSRQLALIDMYIEDITEAKPVLITPAIRVMIQVRSPSLIPSWLVSPQFSISSFLGGLAVVLMPKIFEFISAWHKKSVPLIRP